MADEACVHIIDDDWAVSEAVSFLLAAEGLPSRKYDSAKAFLGNATQATAGCVLSDACMPGIDGLELLRTLRLGKVGIPFIVMTGHADIPRAVEAMKQGALDFIEKPFDEKRVLSAIRAALDRDLAIRKQRRWRDVVGLRLASLSKREKEVLEGIVEGKANKVIAIKLDLSPRTVEIHRAKLMAKMQASSVPELVRMFLELA